MIPPGQYYLAKATCNKPRLQRGERGKVSSYSPLCSRITFIVFMPDMKRSYIEQLRETKKKKGLTPKQELENLFCGETGSASEMLEEVDWDHLIQCELEKHFGKEAVFKLNHKKTTDENDMLMNYAILSGISVLVASCLFMVGKNCTNMDDSPKFSL